MPHPGRPADRDPAEAPHAALTAAPRARLPVRSLWVLTVLIVALGALALQLSYRSRLAQQSAQLQTMAKLRATEVHRWLQDRLLHAEFVRGNARLAELYLRWADSGDRSALAQLLIRSDSLRKAFGSHSALVLDAQGRTLALDPGEADTSAGDPVVSPALRAAVQRAISSG